MPTFPRRARAHVILVTLTLAACASAPATASAAYNLTVSSAATANVTPSGNGYTANGPGANVNAGDLSADLLNGFAELDTGSTGGQPGTVTITSPVAAAVVTALIIDSASSVTIAAPISVGGDVQVRNGRTTTIATPSIVADHAIEFTGPVNLTNDVTLTSERFKFESIDGAHALSVLGVRDTQDPFGAFAGAIGGVTPLAALTVTADEVQVFADVRTTGTQRYNTDVRLESLATTFTSSGAGVVFNGVAYRGAMTVSAAGGAAFYRDLSLPSLVVNGGPATIDAALIQTAGTQTWNAPILLAGDTRLEARDDLVLANAVNGAHDLTLFGDEIAIDGIVGATTALASLTTVTPVTVSAASITTSGPQVYELNVTVPQASNLVATGGPITFQRDLVSTTNVGVSAATTARFERTTTAATLDTTGSTLTELAGNRVTVTNALRLGSTNLIDRVQLYMTGAATMTSQGTFHLGTNTLELQGTATFAGSVTGSGDFRYQGVTGTTLTFAGTSTYSGPTFVDGGNVIAASTTGLSPNTDVRLPFGAASNLVVQAASATVGSVSGSGGTIALGSNALTVGVANTSTTFGGVISGSGRITKAGSGTWTIGNNNPLTGTVAVMGGTLSAAQQNALLAVSAVEVTAPGTLVASQLELDRLTGTGTITGTPLDLVVDNAAPDTFGGIIGGVTRLVATGSAPLTLAGLATSTGPVTVDAGSTLVLASSTALPLSPTLSVNGTFDLSGTSLRPAQLAGSGTVTNTSVGTPSSLVLDTATAATTAFTLAGNLDVTKRGAAPLVLGAVNTYTGRTNVDAGAVVPGLLGALPETTTLTVASGAIADFAAADQTITALRGAGTVATGGPARTLTLSGTNGFVWNGSLTGAGTIDVTAAGGHALTGASPSFTGTLLLHGNEIDVTGSAPGMSVTLQGELRGTGVVGAVTTTGWAAVEPGLSTAGTLRTGPLSLGATSMLRMDVLDRTTADRVVVTGTVRLDSGALSLGASAALPAGATVVLVDNDGTDPVSGTFFGLPDGGTMTIGGVAHTVSYVGGSGNDITLSGPPAPVAPAPVTTTPAPVVTAPGGTTPGVANPSAGVPLSIVIGLDRAIAYAGRSLQLRIASTQAGALRVQVLRGHTVVSTRYLRAIAGRSTKSFGPMPKKPGTYVIRATVTSNGISDTATTKLVVRAAPRR